VPVKPGSLNRRLAAIAVIAVVALTAAARGPATASADPPTGICESGLVSCATVVIGPVGGDGSARITSDPAGIDCIVTAGVQSGTCTAEVRWSVLEPNPEIVLTIAPGSGARVCRFSCMEVDEPYLFSWNSPEAGATYKLEFMHLEQITQALSVGLGGGGAGTVTSVPAGIACGSVCTAALERGTSVSLFAVPASSSTFAGWTGACSGQPAICQLTLSTDLATTANFTPPSPPPLTPPTIGPPVLTPVPPITVPAPPKRAHRVFAKVTLPSRVAHIAPGGGAIWLRVSSSVAANLKVVVPSVSYYVDESHRRHFALAPVMLTHKTEGTIVFRVPAAERPALASARRADLLGLKITATIGSTGVTTRLARSRVQVDLRPPLRVPPPLTQPR
jgi:hypothetical protein